MSEYSEYFKKHRFDRTGTRCKIYGSWGARDYFKYYRHKRVLKGKKPIKSEMYHKLVRRVDELLFRKLVKEGMLELPYGLGTIEILGRKFRSFIQDGKLVHQRPVDWDSTFRLWFEDKEAEKNKILIYCEHDASYIINYRKCPQSPSSLLYYEFFPTRLNRKLITESIRKNGIIYEHN